VERLLEWCGTRSVRTGRPERDDILRLISIPGTAAECIGAPLLSDDGPLGVLVAESSRVGAFRAEHEALVRDLIEPLSVALVNDARHQELERLRETLEADKRALLSRLGRQELTDAIVGAEGGFRGVMERVEQVAPTDVPVLLLGETGTGKEVVARAIHSKSSRAAGPIMRINCGALPPGLIDSELFGHERGSFTGAVATRQGWFERADGGTLFLDEVGELPLDAQVRLLRILQDGTFERVGGHKPQKADVRVIAATHRDLRSMVSQGSFREDLWYRLSVFPLRLPPLRERLQDIPHLAAHFAARTGVRLAGRALIPSEADIELLVRYSWPGNIRELAAVVERAAILGDGKRLNIAAALGGAMPSAAPVQQIESPAAAAPLPLTPASRETSTLDAAMARQIEGVLAQCHGRIEGPFGAAVRLGINPHTLRARMRKLGVDWARYRATRKLSG
jgi:transcriptional regulator with GAF, ATPase, and Fis domain